MSPAEHQRGNEGGRTTETKESRRSLLPIGGDDENHGSSYGSVDNSALVMSAAGATSASPKDGGEQITYIHVLRTNSNYRNFLLSYLINKMGEWMTYLASITLIQEVTSRGDTNQNSYTLISILILVKLLPNVLFLPIGGILADSYDRRWIQVALDLFSACVVVVFLWSFASESIFLLMVANFLIETSSGLYIPSNQSMLPMMFGVSGKSAETDNEELKKANLLYGLSWSLMAAIGASLGGVLVTAFGIKGCFIIDSITYLISAAILRFGVEGNYNANASSTQTSVEDPQTVEIVAKSSSSPPEEESDVEDDDSDSGGLLLYIGGLKFLFFQAPLVGACTLLKGSAALTYGAVDVLNVSFSVRGSESDPSESSLKLGLLFGCVGVGCILGAVVTDALSDLARPQRIARVCLGGFSCLFVGMLWMSATPDLFASLCLSTVVRSIGSAVVWINSTLLIQKFTPPALLGRVSSFDSGVALFAEAFSALGGGMMMDQNSLSADQVSLILAGTALFFLCFWSPLACRFENKKE